MRTANDTLDPLDTLSLEAGNLTAASAAVSEGAAPAEPEAPSLTNQQCLTMAWEIIRDTLCAVANVKSPKSTLSAEVIGPMAEAQAAVFDKNGIDLAGMSGNYMVEIRAAIVTLPVLLAFRGGLQMELAAAKKIDKPAAAAPAAPQAQVHQQEFPSATLVK